MICILTSSYFCTQNIQIFVEVRPNWIYLKFPILLLITFNRWFLIPVSDSFWFNNLQLKFESWGRPWEKKHIESLLAKTCWGGSSIATVIIRKVLHEWPTSPEIFAVPQLAGAIKKLRFSFQLPKRPSCDDDDGDDDDDGTNYKTTRWNFTLGHRMPKPCRFPLFPCSPVPVLRTWR